jgi:glycosyltransferase involved in cell wall biosynthesis
LDQWIGVVVHDLSPGGTERIALRLAGAWSRSGREVIIFCGNPTGALAHLVPEGCRLVSPDRPIRRGFGSRRRLGKWVAASVRDRPVAGLFVPGNFHFPVLDAFPAEGPRPVLVAKLSNSLERRGTNRLRRMVALRLMARRLRRADHVVAMSPALNQEARRLLGDLPLAVVPEPILDDDSVVPPTGKRHGIIAAGRFAAQKDFGLAVEAMAALPADERLTILGDGEEMAAIKALVAALGLGDRVALPGRVIDVRPAFAKAKVFLLPSRYEGYPAVLVEAIEAGCRIVATDCSPAIREIVDDPALGEVVASSDPADLAAALARQLRLPPPPAEQVDRITAPHRMAPVAARYLSLLTRA